jgi:hypothetical protein
VKKYKPYIKHLAVYGCYSIAVVYLMVGLMAILSFLGESDNGASEEGIIDAILEIPLGEVIIVVIVLGLLGYITWRVFEAITDPYDFGSDFKGIARRTGIGLSATGYAIIGFSAIQIVLEGGGNGEEDQQLLVGQVLDFPAGAWIIGIAGAIVAFAGLVQFKYVYGGDYNKRFKYDQMPDKLVTTTHILAWVGYIARGIILLVIAYFLISAAIEGDPSEVGDTDSAFDFLGDFGVIGHIGFILVALGTMAYGVFMIISGRYYSFKAENEEEKE